MLARRLLALLGVELTAYALVLLAAARGTLPWVSAVAIVAGAHVALRCAAVPLGLLVAVAAGSAERRSPLGVRAALAVYARECGALWVNYVLAPFDPWLRAPGGVDPTRAAAAAHGPGVILVHGILCNRVVWRPFQAALRRHGRTARALNLRPLLGSIDTMAAQLAAMLRRTPGPIVVVAHSMGGLVARRALQLDPALPVAAVVTIATPHRGAAQATLAPGAAARAMRRGSRWLADLDRGAPPLPHVRRLAIRSVHDEFVTPAESARWDGAREYVLERVGHVALLADERVVDAVAAEIAAVANALAAAGDRIPERATAIDPDAGRGP